MFAFIRGRIASKELSGGPVDHVVLEVEGIGFDVMMSSRGALTLGKIDETVIVHTSLVVRETELSLFGFAKAEEKRAFLLLQTVTGVGPRLALSIVGTLGVKLLVDAICADDTKTISQTPGVGPKVAQRIVLELKSKVSDMAGKDSESTGETNIDQEVKHEVREILEGLGYTGTEINMVLKKLSEQEPDCCDVESIVRASLKILGSAGVTG